MVARYGYIPTPETVEDGGSSIDRRLRLFLSEFVMGVGLLVRREEEVVDEVPNVGEGVINQADSPSIRRLRGETPAYRPRGKAWRLCKRLDFIMYYCVLDFSISIVQRSTRYASHCSRERVRE
jgi:hypothetical protein